MKNLNTKSNPIFEVLEQEKLEQRLAQHYRTTG